ncbi:hypothetical protein AMIS_20260 [Actinoplanes missouriensis 431]|uniref:Uncharacterized protein n=1 Tax=Actinoplanes missouriensis (strain ATCC 14538 / DSM 43046 / CBS 188.64 / JCM 3121 / NBRC 102363 / NCIMB 12654 / NRRL B-3342 / UNCC 431) TaxID=512565 RepID=I0H2K9_ACTM4|nr:hypothetical protein [Actinoplanes missouriensis]BAL87246.1 hypothetical protein AMIS_20260 [Actinoplanes missouriensis 431]
MQIVARIVHDSTETTLTGGVGEQLAEFFTRKRDEWVSGRRHGDIEFNADQGRTRVSFEAITAFDVEVTP